jgi:hypothetical protein
MSFTSWKMSLAYLRDSHIETTMEEAVLDFFYNGLSRWLQDSEYTWSMPEDDIADKFVRLCYMINQASKSSYMKGIQINKVNHRDLLEDVETFDLFANISSFADMLDNWSCYSNIVGTKYDLIMRDFCYVWADIEGGAPGRWTQTTLEMDDEIYSDDEKVYNWQPETNWRKSNSDML